MGEYGRRKPIASSGLATLIAENGGFVQILDLRSDPRVKT
jgi:hypothetical protein